MTLSGSSEHLHAIELPTPFPVGPVTVYLADAPGEPLTLIDTGPHTAEARAVLDESLERLGHNTSDLARIIITHAHADHFDLAAELVSASQATVWSHAWNFAALANGEDFRAQRVRFYAELMQEAGVPTEIMLAIGQATGNVNRYTRPVTAEATLREGDTLRMAGSEWQVLHTPGHSAGLICLHDPASQTLISSDHLLAYISSNPVVEPPPPGQSERPRSLVLYQRSLLRVASMGIQRALPGHGPIIRDVADLVQQRMGFHQRRVERVAEALHQGARTTWEVTQTLFPNLSPLDTFLAVSEVIGHLDLLEMEGEITRDLTRDLAHSKAGELAVWRLVRAQAGA